VDNEANGKNELGSGEILIFIHQRKPTPVAVFSSPHFLGALTIFFHNILPPNHDFTIDHSDRCAYIHITSREIPAGLVLRSRGK
jgi:hypothetical protein